MKIKKILAFFSSKKGKQRDKLSSLPIPKSKNPKPKVRPAFKRVALNLEQKRRINTEILLVEKKLILLLDLDHTLLNATTLKKLSSNEDYLLHTGDKKISICEDFIIKLRPYVHTFLLKASKLFDLYVCTMGSHKYALKMAELLDPQGIYFSSSKIISRKHFKEEDQKDLGLVLGEERIVVILDDSVNVWKDYTDNLIVISRYNYFASSNNLYGYGNSLCEMKVDEDEFDGALALAFFKLERIHRLFYEGHDKDVRRVINKIGDEES